MSDSVNDELWIPPAMAKDMSGQLFPLPGIQVSTHLRAMLEHRFPNSSPQQIDMLTVFLEVQLVMADNPEFDYEQLDAAQEAGKALREVIQPKGKKK